MEYEDAQIKERSSRKHENVCGVGNKRKEYKIMGYENTYGKKINV